MEPPERRQALLRTLAVSWPPLQYVNPRARPTAEARSIEQVPTHPGSPTSAGVLKRQGGYLSSPERQNFQVTLSSAEDPLEIFARRRHRRSGRPTRPASDARI